MAETAGEALGRSKSLSAAHATSNRVRDHFRNSQHDLLKSFKSSWSFHLCIHRLGTLTVRRVGSFMLAAMARSLWVAVIVWILAPLLLVVQLAIYGKRVSMHPSMALSAINNVLVVW